MTNRSEIKPATLLAGRYKVKDPPIALGGMGQVYKVYDTVTQRYVALKTISFLTDPAVFSQFVDEWQVLAKISHPNIVDVLETGQFEDRGQLKPFIVMPLLPGETLDQLIKSKRDQLTVERTVEIIDQVCTGLQVAHDYGVVHGDLKPSNIFVLDDDSVKIIDFGMLRLAEAETPTGIKGTLPYLAPELLAGQATSPLSDIFSLAVASYEALTGTSPFARLTDYETAEAICTYNPPPASKINVAVNALISRTVHKAMAKQPLQRFSNAREFGEVLKKALRNEAVEYFDASKVQPRIERVKKAQDEGDYQFARDILNELEAEGHLDPEIPLLRIRLDQAIQQKTIRQLLENARMRIEEEEYPLALQKIQEILEIAPQQVDALHMKAEIEKLRSEKKVDQWYRLVHEHIANQLFSQARQDLEEILRLRPSDVRASALLAHVYQQEHVRTEKEQLYASALDSYCRGEIGAALDKLESMLLLSRQSLETGNADKDQQYQLPLHTSLRMPIFISHSSADADFATKLARQLQAHGYEAWVDTEQLTPGEVWQSKIDEIIRSCKVAVVLLNPSAPLQGRMSLECRALLEHAWNDATKQIIPILLGTGDPPNFLKGLTSIVYRTQSHGPEATGEVVAALLSIGKKETFRHFRTLQQQDLDERQRRFDLFDAAIVALEKPLADEGATNGKQ